MKKLDSYQLKAVKSSNNTLLIAAAGSGKTFTIINKINYLISKGINERKILVISFTNKSVDDLKRKINNKIDIYTFHKLAISILEYNNIVYSIAQSDLLDYVCEEYFLSLNDLDIIKKILKYYHLYDYAYFLNSNYYIDLKKIIITFIHLYKTNNKKIDDIKNYFVLDSLLVTIILNILTIYNIELKSTNSLDFDDLIIESTKYVNNYKKYDYIIIDEFQDTSLIRWNLINSLRIASNSKFFCVGDDYQSIYRFSGCDLNIFLNFSKIIPNTKIMYLKNTYRNSQELIDIATKFILRNPKQLKKSIISEKHLKKPIIITYYFNKYFSITRLLDKLILKYDDILILGRNNFDIYNYIPNVKIINNIFKYKDKEIKYMTIHSSKGLEADTVIMINLINDIYGLPNKIKNNKLLNTSSNEILYEEERRLFYVGLTRTKNEVYLLTPLINKSIFVKEIKTIIKEYR